MAYTDIQICNISMTLIGETAISSLESPATPVETMLANIYEPLKEDALKGFKPNFAMKRASLTEDTSDPAFEFENQFVLPTDYLIADRINQDDEQLINYRVEGQLMLTDEETVELEYVANIDESLFTSDFALMLALKIAVYVCFSITKNLQKEDRLKKDYAFQRKKVIANDSIENRVVRQSKETQWLTERI